MITRASAAAMDANDPLSFLRDAFHLPEGVIYLDGNSLGAAPVAVFDQLHMAVHNEWATDLIGSWNKAGWFAMTGSMGDRLAKMLGAGDGELVICDSTSVNIYKALHAALGLRRSRKTIVAEAGSFPTDLYIAESAASFARNVRVRLVGRDADSLDQLLDDDVAVCLLNQVDYKTGELRDMAADTIQAHGAGALVIWDLCHSAGVIPIALNRCDVDFAVGCTYKYLNGGPGAPAFVFAAEKHHEKMRQPLSGWWGHANPFAFETEYKPDSSIRKMLCGTQPVLSMRAIGAALDVYEKTRIEQLREKSIALTELFIQLVDQRCGDTDVEVVSPRDPALRGSHVALCHPDGEMLMRALADRGVIGDFRPPGIMRFGIAPMYIGFIDVWDAVVCLEEVLARR